MSSQIWLMKMKQWLYQRKRYHQNVILQKMEHAQPNQQIQIMGGNITSDGKCMGRD